MMGYPPKILQDVIDGGEKIQDIIQLRSDSKLYKMRFSNGGNKVEGTWAHQDGFVKFTGVKLRDALPG